MTDLLHEVWSRFARAGSCGSVAEAAGQGAGGGARLPSVRALAEGQGVRGDNETVPQSLLTAPFSSPVLPPSTTVLQSARQMDTADEFD